MTKEIEPAKLHLKKCFICNNWTEPRHLVTVVLHEQETEVCRLCYKALVKRQRDLDLEALKEVEDEEATKAFGFERPPED